MAKPEWGCKRQCGSCGARFYDLNRNPILCPKCSTQFEPAVAAPAKPAKSQPKAPPPKPKPEKGDGEDPVGEDVLAEGFELDDEAADDDDDFVEAGDDLDDDVSVVIDSKPGKAESA